MSVVWSLLLRQVGGWVCYFLGVKSLFYFEIKEKEKKKPIGKQGKRILVFSKREKEKKRVTYSFTDVLCFGHSKKKTPTHFLDRILSSVVILYALFINTHHSLYHSY